MAEKRSKPYSIFGDKHDNKNESLSDESSSQDEETLPAQEESDASEDDSPSQVSSISESDDVDDDASDSKSAALSRYDLRRRRVYFSKYRDVMDSIAAAESSDLTRQLFVHHQTVDIHRFKRHPGPRGRKEPINVWRRYTAWPMSATRIPRQNIPVWPDSIGGDDWKPSGELEDTIFAFLLRQARVQWNEKLEINDFNDIKNSQKSGRRKKYADDFGKHFGNSTLSPHLQVPKIGSSSKWPDFVPSWSLLKRKAEEMDSPVLSADDEQCLTYTA
jgi:hypothetical protein